MKIHRAFNEGAQKVIALMGSMDTKAEEILYAKNHIENHGCRCLIIDVSTRCLNGTHADVKPFQVLAYLGMTEQEFEKLDKVGKIESMSRAAGLCIPRLWQEKLFQGILSLGGGQNAKMAADTMKKLPFGVPKLVASSLICGNRKLEQYAGTKDMVMVHTVADMEGLNMVTISVIQNICNAMIGMVQGWKETVTDMNKIRIAVTTLGITSDGAAGIYRSLPKEAFEVTCFHANGVGGRCMEELVETDAFDMVLDMTLHEITCELLGGYCTGSNDRLKKAVEKRLPLIVLPGAVDVIDYYVESANERMPVAWENRKFVFHNSHVVHAKVTENEAERLAEVVAERLNGAKAPVTVVLPLKGFSSESGPGGKLYAPGVDRAFIRRIKETLNADIKVREVDGNINDPKCQSVIVEEIVSISSRTLKVGAG